MVQRRMSIQDFFNRLNKDTINLVDQFYDEQAYFQDPLGKHLGLADIKKYYADLYKNVASIKFIFSKEIIQENVHTAVWTMHLVSKLNSGKPITVDGVSVIEFGGKEDKAVFHRDYFDMGAFVYEGIPVLGSIIRYIKRKLSSH